MKRLALSVFAIAVCCSAVQAQPIARLPGLDQNYDRRFATPGRQGQRVALGQRREDPNGRFYQPAQVIAEVGKEVVFLSDVMPKVNEVLANAKIPPEQYEAQREQLIKAILRQVIQRKMLLQEFILGFPIDKREEIKAQIQEKTHQAFNEALPKILKAQKVSSAAELEAKLRRVGSSLAKLKQSFEETQLAQATLARHVPRKQNVTFDELLAYYEDNRVRYSKRARVRWEQLTIRFDKVPDKRKAYQLIASMGNEIRLGGAKFSAVAKRRSHGINASKGGYHDWVEKGSLSSTKIDQVLFGIPPRLLSRIIEDDRGYHIVRVIAREKAGRIPFDKVQEEITEKLQAKKASLARQEFYKKLMKKYPVRTIFDQRTRAPQRPSTIRTSRSRGPDRGSAFVPR